MLTCGGMIGRWELRSGREPLHIDVYIVLFINYETGLLIFLSIRNEKKKKKAQPLSFPSHK